MSGFMRRFWKKRRLSGAGTSASAQQAPSEQLSTLVEDWVLRLQADPGNITKFQEILNFIDEALERHRKLEKCNAHVPEVINGNVEGASETLRLIHELCANEDGKAQAQIEIQQILSKAFGGVGTLHWITAAFSMVAFTLNRVDSTSSNKETSLDLLQKVQELGRKLVDLFRVAPTKRDEFWNIGSSIIEVAIFCMRELNASYCRRFSYVYVRTGDVSKFEEEIRHLYQKLNLMMAEETNRRIPPPIESYQPEDPHIVGREKIVNGILGVIQQVPQSSLKVHAILLQGFGGIGKTTIANKICRVAESGGQYKSITHVHIGDNPTSQDTCNCQKLILEMLNGSRRDIGSESEGRRMLHDHFRTRTTPILLFVDDVSQSDDLETLLPTELFSILPENSCVLVTSRDERLSEAFGVSGVEWTVFRVNYLEQRDAKALLLKYLGPWPEDRSKQLDEVQTSLGGWPLAIKVVGSHLKRYKDDDMRWKASIKQLQECNSLSNDSEDRLKKYLEWGYNKMDEAGKNVFLDISCLLRNSPWSWVQALGTGLEVRRLEDLSLLRCARKREWDGDKETAEIHDLLVALGQQKSSETNPASRIYSRDGSLPSILGVDDHEGERSSSEVHPIHQSAQKQKKIC